MTLPPSYTDRNETETAQAIQAAKRALGKKLLILAHHYQRDEVVQWADFRGDSLELSQRVAREKEARYIVFCGVYFMAETAAILAEPGQTVIQPEAEAFCPMARMADPDDAREAWSALAAFWPGDVTPITYQNSTAALKAFVGEQGGAVCTSSNAASIFDWAFQRGRHILFTPDQYLGTNTALAMGLKEEAIGLWDPLHPPARETLASCRVVVWKGFCYVHTTFTPQDVDEARQRYPGARVIVHPECSPQVVAKADQASSTTGMIRFVEAAPTGSALVVGTECRLVDRLAKAHPEKTIVPLRRSFCVNMGLTTIHHLLYVLDGILEGKPRNVVQVEEQTARWARVATERMLQVI